MEIQDKLWKVYVQLRAGLSNNTDDIGVDIGLRLRNENDYIFVDMERKEDVLIRLFKAPKNSERMTTVVLEEEKIENIPVQVITMLGKVSPKLDKYKRIAREKYQGPLIGGIPINGANHSSDSNFGTLGAIVYDKDDEIFQYPFLLSCHHVICDAVKKKSVTNSNVFHPPFGSKTNDDKDIERSLIGKMKRSGINTKLDCAVARINEGVKVDNHILGLGPIKGIRTPQLGRVVRKSGAKTGITWGIIDGMNGTWKLKSTSREVYGSILHITPLGRVDGKQFEISHRGDSGSLWLTDNNDAVGLHFAGEMDRPLEYALALPIHDVMESLKFRFKF